MKIGFLLCSPDISGGTNVIFEYVVGLQKMGHNVSIITEKEVNPKRYLWHEKAHSLHWDVFTSAQKENFDILIATWWESPYYLHTFHSTHYVYFVQSIESKFFRADDPGNLDFRDHSVGAARCNNSYFFSIPIITEATWIKKYLKKKYNHQPYVVKNGIRKELYSDYQVVKKRPTDKLRVLVEGPLDTFHKNVPRTIELCVEAGVDEIWLLTSSNISSFPGVDRVFSQVPIAQTPGIYGSCNILVKLSYVEGMFGPPLEMFHCGGTALVYDVTGHDEYIEHDRNGLVVEKDNESGVVTLLRELKANRAMLDRLSAGARDTADKWPGWSTSVKAFNDVLKEISTQPEISRDYLKNISNVLWDYQRMQIESRELKRFANREACFPEGNKDECNFIQAYLYSGGDLVAERWSSYDCATEQTVSIVLEGQYDSFQMRIDPGVRIGIILLFSIRIIETGGNVISQYLPDTGFEKLCLTGSARWLDKAYNCWTIESFGNDPQLFLPDLKNITARSLTLEVSLMDLGFTEYMNRIRNKSCFGSTLSGAVKQIRDTFNVR